MSTFKVSNQIPGSAKHAQARISFQEQTLMWCAWCQMLLDLPPWPTI